MGVTGKRHDERSLWLVCGGWRGDRRPGTSQEVAAIVWEREGSWLESWVARRGRLGKAAARGSSGAGGGWPEPGPRVWRSQS